DQMAVERLSSKFELFESLLSDSSNDWNTLLYRQVSRSFGLASNIKAFYEIARNLQIDIIIRHSPNLFQLEALFLGTAGLLNDPQDNYSASLSKEYEFLKLKYGLKTISTKLQTGGMRPMSLPGVKLAQLAALFHYQPNIIQKILNFPSIGELRSYFEHSCSPYWDTHYVLGKESRTRSKRISKNTFELIVINAIAPMLFLYARKRGLPQKEEEALQYLQEIQPEEHRIIRLWEEFEIRPESAQDSQGLLHLYKTYCTFKRCLNCRIGKYILSKA
ncbi:DUF2851 family protein, partial [bacterium]|nr:DUF2851 family protein [bacterium]